MLWDAPRRSASLSFLWLLLVCGPIGCSSEGEPCWLTGEVTFNGQPLDDGDLRLDPIEGTPGPGGSARITGGRYRIPVEAGMLAGEHRVSITATRKTGRIIRNDPPYPGEPPEFPEVIQYIPAKYNLESELTVTLAPGENTQDFVLTGRK